MTQYIGKRRRLLKRQGTISSCHTFFFNHAVFDEAEVSFRLQLLIQEMVEEQSSHVTVHYNHYALQTWTRLLCTDCRIFKTKLVTCEIFIWFVKLQKRVILGQFKHLLSIWNTLQLNSLKFALFVVISTFNFLLSPFFFFTVVSSRCIRSAESPFIPVKVS